MVRLIFRHISGARATEVDVVTLGSHRELILGRASSAAVRFDAKADMNVGRHHARIAWTTDDPTHFTLADLSSRNGTFVNDRRLMAAITLQPGDIVRLGANGPEVELRWEMFAVVSPCPGDARGHARGPV